MLLVKLHFTSPLHIGTEGSTMENVDFIIHSDTIYSALTHASLELFGEPIGDISLSSAFPFVGDLLFFPKPMLPFVSVVQGENYLDERRKDLKSLSFVAEPCFRQWLAGQPVDLEYMLGASEILSAAVKTDLRPRVNLGRTEVKSQLYFIGHTSYSPEAGLFCLIDPKGVNDTNLKAMWRYLGDQGIGGEKSSGYGQFSPEFATWESFCPEEAQQYVTLSLTSPNQDELDHLVAYRLIRRGGWIWSPNTGKTARRCTLTMVTEGSVFSKPVRGRIVDVAPPSWNEHPVMRYGKAFLIGAGALS